MVCVVAAGAGNKRHTAVYCVLRAADDVILLLVGKGRRFAGGSVYNDSVGAVFDEHINEISVFCEIYGTVLSHRSHSRDAAAFKYSVFHKNSPIIN